MKNIEYLIQKAVELQSKGLVTGQIADELNVSRETVTWLLTRSKKEATSPAPRDISVDWSNIGKSSHRLRYTAKALSDMVLESITQTDSEIDVVVGIASSGIPLASLMADELGTEFAVFHSHKDHIESTNMRGTFSRHFGDVTNKNCVIVDDVITSGKTIIDAIDQIRELGAKPVAVTVLVDKNGADILSDVPVNSLVRIVRVG
ncbi:MAG TPA: orotate phosphoribosyltransferase-like protein [Methanosarcinaceae archaeon]|nr:orotate phosphoribosyltransferase-like protein [Methanosarcinaceae archaeon]